MKLDSAAISVSRDFSKKWCAAIGRSTWSRSRIIINALEDCRQWIEKFHKVGKNFIKSSKNSIMLDGIKKKYADATPNKSFTIDLSEAHTLINSSMRMKKGQKNFSMGYEISSSN